MCRLEMEVQYPHYQKLFPPPPEPLYGPRISRRTTNTPKSGSHRSRSKPTRDSVFDRLHDPTNYTGVYQERFRSGPGINQFSDARSPTGVQIRTRYGEGVVSDIGDVTRPNLRYDRKPSARDIAKKRMNDEYNQRMQHVLSADRKERRQKRKQSLTESFAKEAEAMLKSLPQEPFDTDTQLQLIFQYYCRFGRTGGKGEDEDTMDNVNFAKFCRECPDLLDQRLNISEVDLIFAKCKGPRSRRLKYSQFLDALAALAHVKFPNLEPITAFSILLSRYVFNCPASVGIHALTEEYMENNRQIQDTFSFEDYSKDESVSEAGEDNPDYYYGAQQKSNYDYNAYPLHNYGYGFGMSNLESLERPSISSGIVSGEAAPILSPPPPGTPRRRQERSFSQATDETYGSEPVRPPPPMFSSPNTAAYEQYARARERYTQSQMSVSSRPESVRSSGSRSARSVSRDRKNSTTYSLGGAGVPTPRKNGSGSLRRPSHSFSTKSVSSVRSPSTLGTQDYVPTVAGEANAPGDVYDRLSRPESFTGVYKRAYLTDGRINHFSDTGQSAVPSEYVGDTNTGSNECIHDIRYLLRPNLKNGPTFK